METNETTMKTKRVILDRPEERDPRVMYTAAGVARLGRGNGLTPYELAVALKLALTTLVKANRAPMATIHQFRGFLLDIEAEMVADEETGSEGDEEKGGSLP